MLADSTFPAIPFNRPPADRRFSAFVKLTYVLFLTFSLVVGGRFLHQFGQAAYEHWRNPGGVSAADLDWTVQEFRFAPVELDPAVQTRVDQLLLNDTGADAVESDRSVGSD